MSGHNGRIRAARPIGRLDGLAPPHSLDAEAAALAACMIDAAVFNAVVELIGPGDFYSDSNRIIFTALLAIRAAGRPVDSVVVFEELAKQKLLAEVGGKNYIADVLGSVPSAANGLHYAAIVREKADRRRIIATAERAVKAACDGSEGAAEIAARAGSELAQVAAGGAAGGAGPILTLAADVEPRPISWLWRGRIPAGRISLLVGRPGEGKSFLSIDAAARVSTGTPWPDGAPCTRGSVLIVSGEDDPHDTIRPRLDAHHADVGRIVLLSAVRRVIEGKAHEVAFTLADVAALAAALAKLPDCRLVIVDPIGSFLGGGVDSHRDNEVRAVLAPVAALAEKCGAAVLIVAHRRKAGGDFADDLALGSRAFTGIPRATWHLSRDPMNKTRRLLLPGKNNLAPEGDGLAFTIGGEPAAVAWEREPVKMTADEALAHDSDNERPGPEPVALPAAVSWLADVLADGALATAAVKQQAESAGLAWRTVQRAADALKVKRDKSGFDGGWTWRLPRGDEDAKPE